MGFGSTPSLKSAGYKSPNEKLNFAAIGSGGQGASNISAAAPTENIVALCDVDDRRAANTFTRFEKATKYKDFRQMLDKEGKNVDAVIVAIPDHMHATAAMWAMERGKHVYVQKPLVRTVWEARQLREAATKYKVATQMGNQGYSNEGTRQAAEIVWNGDLGGVTEVHAWSDRPMWPQGLTEIPKEDPVPSTLDWDLWLGVAEKRPFTADGKTDPDRNGGFFYQPFNWRGFYDFGCGALGDMACHGMDAAFWALDLGYPRRIEAEATTSHTETAPKASRITYWFPAKGNRGEIKVVWRDGGIWPPKPDILGPDDPWPPEDIGGQMWVGDGGALLAGMYGEDPKLLDAAKDAAIRANPPAKKYPRSAGVYAEWIQAITGKGPAPNSSFDGHAGHLTEMVLLGNLAIRSGRVVELDPATGAVKNLNLPPEMITSPYRAGWTL
jgi:predicted dehydrogenase